MKLSKSSSIFRISLQVSDECAVKDTHHKLKDLNLLKCELTQMVGCTSFGINENTIFIFHINI